MTDYVAELTEEVKPEVEETDAEAVLPSLEEAQTFLKLLDPDATKFNFQTYSDTSNARKPKTYEFALAPVQWSILSKANREGSAIAVSVQAMKGEDRSSKNVDYVRAVFLDFDDGEPDWDAFALRPSIVVQTSPEGWHAYWLCGPNTPVEEFDAIQSALISKHNGDPACKDLARAMRLPGTLHMKRPGNPFLVRVTGGNCRRYTGAELREAFVGTSSDGGRRTVVVSPAATKGIIGGAHRSESNEQLLAKYRHAFDAIPDCTSPAFHYDDWRTCGMALKTDCGDTAEAFALFDGWSREKDPARYGSEAACRSAWDNFRSDHPNPVHFGTIVLLVRRHKPSFDPLLTTAKVTKKQRTWVEWPDCGPKGGPLPNSIQNVRHFLDIEDIALRYNEFTCSPERWSQSSEPRALTDAKALEVWRDMHDRGCKIGLSFLKEMLGAISLEDAYHPVRDGLLALKWDGEERVESFFPKYAGVDDTPLHRAYSRAWLVALVRRVMKPGCELFGVPILEDAVGGAGKSTLFKALATPPLFTDSVTLGDTPKEVLEVAHGKLIIEVSELGGLRSRDWDLIKAMITRTQDRARKAFDRFTSEEPRQFVIAATTNQTEYLQDSGGLRRFWAMKVIGKMDVGGVARDRDQILAEAVMLEAKGEPHNIPEPLWAAAAETRQDRIAVSHFEAVFGDELEASPEGFLHRSEIIAAIQARDLDAHRTKFTDADLTRHGFRPVQLRKGEHRGKRGFQRGDETGWLTYSRHKGFALGEEGNVTALRKWASL